MNSLEGEKLKNYWQNQLAGELPVLDLPASFPRPPLRTYNGSSCTFKLNNELTQQLRQLALTEGVTIYAILLAAFKVLLSRYTGEENILVGLLINRKIQQEFERGDE